MTEPDPMRTVFHEANVFDARTGFRCADIVVSDGLIAEVAPSGSIKPNQASARSILASGKTLLPGFIDAHAHPMIAGREARELSVRSCNSVEEVQRVLADYAESHPQSNWVIGEGFELAIADDGNFFASDLDAVVWDRPVALRSNDAHTYWCNSQALDFAGISATTPDPKNGIIERYSDGTPSGTLREWGAFELLNGVLPVPSVKDRASDIMQGLRDLAQCGITSATDAWVDAKDIDAYIQAAEQGLPLKLNLALRADPADWKSQLAEFWKIGDRLAGLPTADRLTASTVKFFADGIIENATAAVHAPYSGTSCCGLPNWPSDELSKAMTAFDALGFDVHVHAIGDSAVTAALDGIEQMTRQNGPRDRRPSIAHAQLVAQDDRVRFASTGTTAVLQPFWAKMDPTMAKLTIGRLADERQNRQYPFKSLLDAGARIAFSSDYPISSPNPLHGIAVAMSRNGEGNVAEAWLPDQICTLAQAITAYTAGSAYVTHTAHNSGLLQPGQPADLVLINGNIETFTAAQILGAGISSSWVDGREFRPAPVTASNSAS